MIDQQILDAFEQMWGPFPEPVLLIHKDRTILAANQLARSAGCSTGIKCFSLNPQAVDSPCKQCKASLALREHRPVCMEEMQNGQRVVAFWVPLKETPDIYVHLGIGTAAVMGVQPYPTLSCADQDLVTANR